jgi:tetratricopeptide (TPR) repeat protein
MGSYRKDPPYVDEKLIKDSLDIWNKGAEIKLPDADYSWAYASRALINEQLDALPDYPTSLRDLCWEAVVYIERALLLHSWDVYSYTYLGRYHSAVGNYSAALQATGMTLSYQPDNPTVLEERIQLLVDLGDYDEAKKRIEEREKGEPSLWIDGVKAFILLYTGYYNGALPLVTKAIETEPKNIWYRDIRAALYRMLDEESLAKEDYEAIWNLCIPRNRSNRDTCAWAAYSIGKVKEAIEIYRELCDDPIEAGSAYRNLALIHMAQGDLVDGEKELAEGIRRARRIPELYGLVVHAFRDLEKTIPTRPDGDNLRHALDRLKKQVEERKAELAQRPSATFELEQIVKELERKEKSDDWAWIGAQAGLARLYADEERWSEAAVIYQLMQKESKRFPEAHIGLDNAIDALQAEGDRRLRDGKGPEAVKLFGQALLFETELSHPDKLAILQEKLGDALLKDNRPNEAIDQFAQALDFGPVVKDKPASLYARIGFAHFALGNRIDARANFSRALQLYHVRETAQAVDTPDIDSSRCRQVDHVVGEQPKMAEDPGTAFGTVCRSLLRDASQYWALEDEWKAFEDESGTDQSLAHDLTAARRALGNYLDELYKLSGQTGDEQLIPIVTPVVLEIGSGLIPEDTGTETWSLFKFYIPEMRKRIQDGMGVAVPGVRVRRNNALAANDYVVMLDEIPLVKSAVQLDRRYCPVSAAKLQELGIPQQSLVEAPHPQTGEPGCWILRDNWGSVTGNGVELWAEPLVYVIYDLEAVLLRNLADFLGVQEVENLLETLGKKEGGSALIEAALPDPASRLRFARLLRALVRERVSITQWENILKTFQTQGLATRNVAEAVRDVRVRLKNGLPGNDMATRRAEFPPEIEDQMAKWVSREDGKAFFAASSEETHRLLSMLRDWMKSKDRNIVLVTRSSRLRPFIRQLVEAEFPDLMVLSQEELLS